ncbi:MAG: GTP-binding protein [Thermoplasmata archaeon]|nr:GTP-binding protein [Thermoplasmata archaeon]
MRYISDIEKQIKEIEEEIFSTQYNKATEHHIGKLKAKLAQLKEQLEREKSRKGGGKGFLIKKSGDATVAILGFPNVGKSTLLKQLTGVETKVADYDFTTIKVIPGMMKHNGANIQILDLPGIIKGASVGRGRGREILSAIRNIDLALIIVDSNNNIPNQISEIIKELYAAGIRLNEKPPDIKIVPKSEGGINISKTISLKISDKTIKAIVSEYYVNADVIIKEDVNEDQLIDYLSKNRAYIKAIVVANKIDMTKGENIIDEIMVDGKKWKIIPVSAKEKINLNLLKKEIFSELNLIRIYLKPIGGDIDYNKPMILKKNALVEDVCKKLHRDFVNKFKYALVWGKSVKYPGQRVGLDHVLEDEDVVTIISKR